MSAHSVRYTTPSPSPPRPGFRPAAATADQRAAQLRSRGAGASPLSAKSRDTEGAWTRAAVTWIGLVVFGIAVILPFWNAMRLTQDDVFVYFVGRYYPYWTAAVCSLAVIWYIAAIRFLFKYAWAEVKSEHTILVITMVTTTCLGLAFILVSHPMYKEVDVVYNELYTNCHFGSHTQKLYEYATELQGIRNTSECAEKDSVEQCEGYEVSSPYTGFLKDLENRYHCAGFCWDESSLDATEDPASTTPIASAIRATALVSASEAQPPQPQMAQAAQPWQDQVNVPQSATQLASLPRQAGTAETQIPPPGYDQIAMSGAQPALKAPPAGGVSVQPITLLLEEAQAPSNLPRYKTLAGAVHHLAARTRHDKKGLPEEGVGLLALNGQRSSAARRSRQRDVDQPGKEGEIPPTLFSKANYQASCDGASAGVLRYKGLHTATMMYYHGVILLVASVAVGFLKVVSACLRPRIAGSTMTQLVL